MLVTVDNTRAVDSFEISRLVESQTLLHLLFFFVTFVRPVPIKVKAGLI